jgi:hypothetical protein
VRGGGGTCGGAEVGVVWDGARQQQAAAARAGARASAGCNRLCAAAASTLAAAAAAVHTRDRQHAALSNVKAWHSPH